MGTTADNYDFKAMLHEAVGAEFALELQRVGFWDLRFALANSYRAGRIFVAGDAAHSHPPYGGYGVNSGLEDARNLGWKLAAVLQGWGGADLLDSYDAERRPVFASTIQDFIAKSIETDGDFLAHFDPEQDQAAFEAAWQARSQGAVGEVHAFEPNYEGSPVVRHTQDANAPALVCSAKGSHQFKARAGHHLAPAIMRSGKNVFEALGAGFTLLTFGEPTAQTQIWVDAAAALNIPLTLVQEAASSETDRYEAMAILVRPDQFVAWASQDTRIDAAQAQQVLSSIAGRQ
jgi:hypothetical protein